MGGPGEDPRRRSPGRRPVASGRRPGDGAQPSVPQARRRWLAGQRGAVLSLRPSDRGACRAGATRRVAPQRLAHRRRARGVDRPTADGRVDPQPRVPGRRARDRGSGGSVRAPSTTNGGAAPTRSPAPSRWPTRSSRCRRTTRGDPHAGVRVRRRTYRWRTGATRSPASSTASTPRCGTRAPIRTSSRGSTPTSSTPRRPTAPRSSSASVSRRPTFHSPSPSPA